MPYIPIHDGNFPSPRAFETLTVFTSLKPHCERNEIKPQYMKNQQRWKNNTLSVTKHLDKQTDFSVTSKGQRWVCKYSKLGTDSNIFIPNGMKPLGFNRCHGFYGSIVLDRTHNRLYYLNSFTTQLVSLETLSSLHQPPSLAATDWLNRSKFVYDKIEHELDKQRQTYEKSSLLSHMIVKN